MSSVLKVLDKNVVFNDLTGELILGVGEIIISAIKTNSGVFVSRTPYHEKVLYQHGIGYIPGSLREIQGQRIFFRGEARSFVQIMVDGDTNLGITPPSLVDTEDLGSLLLQMETIGLLIDSKMSSGRVRIISVPIYTQDTNLLVFDLFQYKPGFCKGVFLVHKELGLVRVVMRHDYSTRKFKVCLEQKYLMLNSMDKKL